MKRSLLALASLSFVSAQSYATDKSMAFTIEQQILFYSQVGSTTMESGKGDVKETETLMATMPNSLQVCATLDDLNLYVYPTAPQGIPLGISYMVRKDLELGIRLERNTNKANTAGTEVASTGMGIWVQYNIPVGEDIIEVSLPLMMTSGVNKDHSKPLDEKTSDINIQFAANYVHTFAKNFSWFGGLGYGLDNLTTSSDGGNKRTVHTSGLLANLTTFRFTF